LVLLNVPSVEALGAVEKPPLALEFSSYWGKEELIENRLETFAKTTWEA
jgi:hypothetical protein